MGFELETSLYPICIILQRNVLTILVNRYVQHSGGFYLRIIYGRADKPSMGFISGIGALYAVWVEIAQLLLRIRGLFRCDAYGLPYMWKGRRRKKLCLTSKANQRLDEAPSRLFRLRRSFSRPTPWDVRHRPRLCHHQLYIGNTSLRLDALCHLPTNEAFSRPQQVGILPRQPHLFGENTRALNTMPDEQFIQGHHHNIHH
jgi:hypothetical protein